MCSADDDDDDDMCICFGAFSPQTVFSKIIEKVLPKTTLYPNSFSVFAYKDRELFLNANGNRGIVTRQAIW